MLTGQSHLGNSSAEGLLSAESRLYHLTVKDNQDIWEMWIVLIIHTDALLAAPFLPLKHYLQTSSSSKSAIETSPLSVSISISINFSWNTNVNSRCISKLKTVMPVIPLVDLFDLNASAFMWTQSAFIKNKMKVVSSLRMTERWWFGKGGRLFRCVCVWWSPEAISQKIIQGAAFGTSPSLLSHLLIIRSLYFTWLSRCTKIGSRHSFQGYQLAHSFLSLAVLWTSLTSIHTTSYLGLL